MLGLLSASLGGRILAPDVSRLRILSIMSNVPYFCLLLVQLGCKLGLGELPRDVISGTRSRREHNPLTRNGSGLLQVFCIRVLLVSFGFSSQIGVRFLSLLRDDLV